MARSRLIQWEASCSFLAGFYTDRASVYHKERFPEFSLSDQHHFSWILATSSRNGNRRTCSKTVPTISFGLEDRRVFFSFSSLFLNLLFCRVFPLLCRACVKMRNIGSGKLEKTELSIFSGGTRRRDNLCFLPMQHALWVPMLPRITTGILHNKQMEQ